MSSINNVRKKADKSRARNIEILLLVSLHICIYIIIASMGDKFSAEKRENEKGVVAMGYRKKHYSSEISAEVYGAWKCRCGQINFVTAPMRYACTETSYSPFDRGKTQQRVRKQVKDEWVDKMYTDLTELIKHNELFNGKLCHCQKCSAKAMWKDSDFEILIGLCAWGAIFCAGCALGADPVAWVPCGIFLAVIAVAKIYEAVHKKNKNIPKEYTPVFGTLNKTLVEYAAAHGETFPTPEECLARVMSYSNEN